MSCILRRREKVVLPELDGPAIMTSFLFRFAISIAMLPIVFSKIASCIRMSSSVPPWTMQSFSAATLPQSMEFAQAADSFWTL